MKNDFFYNEYKTNIIQRIMFGIFMGFSDSVPGYSGGTTLNLLNFYDILILRIKLIFKITAFKNWFKNILWLLPFIFFWIGSILGFSFLSKFLASKNLDLALIFLFVSFSLFCCPLFFLEQQRKIKIFEKGKKKNNFINLLFIIIGFLIFLGISLGVFFNGGISLKNNLFDDNIVDKSKWLPLFFVAILASFVMLIPGISGQLIFYLTNYYKDFSWVILQHPFNNIVPLIIVLCGASIGFITSIFVINFCLRKINKLFISVCFGLVLGSPFSIVLGMVGNQTYINELNNLNNDTFLLISIIICILIGFIINLFLLWYISIDSIKEKEYMKDKDNVIFVFYKNKFNLSKEKFIKFSLLIFAKKYKCEILFIDNLQKLILNDKDNIICCFKNNNVLNEFQKSNSNNKKIYWVKNYFSKTN